MIPRPRPGTVQRCRELCPSCYHRCERLDEDHGHLTNHTDGQHEWQSGRSTVILKQAGSHLRQPGPARTRKAARDTSVKE